MHLYYAEEMRSLDAKLNKQIGIPELVLMENAGQAVARAAEAFLYEVRDSKICVFAGRGNNGGDGLVAARILANRGAKVCVVLTTAAEKFAGSPLAELNLAKQCAMEILTFPASSAGRKKLLEKLGQTDVVIDSVVGTGFTGKLAGDTAQAVKMINTLGKDAAYVIAVDIPSGVEADSGKVAGVAVRADVTVSMLAPKLGLLLYPGAEYAGRVFVNDLGVPREVLKENVTGKEALNEYAAGLLLPRFKKNAHKGNKARIKIIAGCSRYTGAAALASEAAVRSGAGLVSLLVPESIHRIMTLKLTEVMTEGAGGTRDKAFATAHLASALEFVRGADAVAIGPGLGRNENTGEFVRQLLPQLNIPVVIDADGLYALNGHTEILDKMTAPKVLTPHLGEMAGLTGMTIEEILASPVETALRFAREWQAVVLLKGAHSLIASPDGRLYVNTSGNEGMATGGSGDVLTGIIATLLGQGLAATEAATVGAFLHGRAGDEVLGDGFDTGMKAGDLIEMLPVARNILSLAGELGREYPYLNELEGWRSQFADDEEE